jgi:NitT/TauT family transport system substrate-binding protein
LAGAAAPTLLPLPARAAPLRVLAAPSTSSILVAHAVDRLGWGERAFAVWRSPDEMRAAVVGARADVVTLPTNVAANLYNRGLALGLVDVVSAGAMHILSRDPAVRGIDDLRGRRIRLYFRGDMPDVATRWLLARHGLEPGRDVAVDYAGSAVETAQLLLAGRAETALLNEPAASAALLQARAAGIALHRAFTLQEAWAAATGDETPLPLAGSAVTSADVAPRAVRTLHMAVAEAAAWVQAEPASAGRLAAARLGFPAAATTAALEAATIRVDAAVEVRPAIERFLTALAELSPALIGGQLPDRAFYVDL